MLFVVPQRFQKSPAKYLKKFDKAAAKAMKKEFGGFCGTADKGWEICHFAALTVFFADTESFSNRNTVEDLRSSAASTLRVAG